MINTHTSNQYYYMPWIEKYRPRKLDELILTKNSMQKIKKIIDDKDMPNIIITGIPGIGKTTTLKCIASGLFGKYAREAVLEVNASDDRGIQSVQETIKTFCKKKININPDNHSGSNTNGNLCPSHKIIILDEADNMTEQAQHLINTFIETYKETTRFAFTCNSSSDIIEAIQSRCIILRYIRLDDADIISRLKFICEKENVPYEDSALQTIALISGGDMRRAINCMQVTFTAYNELLDEYVFKTCDRPNFVIIKKLLNFCVNKDITFAIKSIANLKHSGFSGSDIVLGMISTIKIDDFNLNEHLKIKFLEKISRTTYMISKGVDTDLQLYGLIVDLVDISN